jgi:predicted nucleic acid-binding protein
MATGALAERLGATYPRLHSQKRGPVLHLPEALIAAAAKTHGLILATGNISDFGYLGVAVLDP